MEEKKLVNTSLRDRQPGLSGADDRKPYRFRGRFARAIGRRRTRVREERGP